MRIEDCLGAPTSPAQTKRLVVAPHADDEALGCGGLLAKHGHESTVAVVAAPNVIRAEEFRAAQRLLGYRSAYLLDLQDGSVGHDMHALVGLVDRVLDACRPQELYLPFPSAHQDHIATYEAGIRSARLSMSEGHWFPPSVLVYDVPAYDLSLYPTDLRWNTFESLDEEHIDTKVAAVNAYTSQIVAGPHPIHDVKQQAHTLGAGRRVAWAERYALVRAVRVSEAPAPVPAGVAVNGHKRLDAPA